MQMSLCLVLEDLQDTGLCFLQKGQNCLCSLKHFTELEIVNALSINKEQELSFMLEYQVQQTPHLLGDPLTVQSSLGP